MVLTLLAVITFALSVTAAALHNNQLEIHPRVAACAQDNCYRAYLHSTDIASPFCSTYIQSTSVTTVTPTVTILDSVTTPAASISTTPIPPIVTNAQLSSRCNLDTVAGGGVVTPLALRLSSACTCIAIVPGTVTSTSIAPATTITLSSCTGLGAHYTFNGKTFSIECNRAGYTDDAPSATNLFTADFQTCVNACALNAQCVLASYAPGLGDNSCFLISSGDFLETAGTGSFSFAFLQ